MPFLSPPPPSLVSSVTYFGVISVSRKLARREQRLVSLHLDFPVVPTFPHLLCQPRALSATLSPFSLGSSHAWGEEAAGVAPSPQSSSCVCPQARMLLHNPLRP